MKLFFSVLLVIGICFSSRAQVFVNASVNIGAPVWIPSGYGHVNYCYIPHMETYYHVPQKVFVYRSGNRWVRSVSPPPRYRHYNLRQARVVVINNDPRPYLHHGRYRQKYLAYNPHHHRAGNMHVRNYHHYRGHAKVKHGHGRMKHRHGHGSW